MKIKNIKTNKFKLTRLHLIKTKTYKNVDNEVNVHIESYLKKSLKIIYDYHCNNKKILFIGIPITIQNKFKNILKKTKHLYITEEIWVRGLLTNRSSLFKFLKKKSTKNKKLKILLSIKKKPDLVILFDETKEKFVIRETDQLKIPLITVNSKMFENPSVLYKIPGNFTFSHKKTGNVFFFMLISIFKKLLLTQQHGKKKQTKPSYIQKVRPSQRKRTTKTKTAEL